ncbi:MAG: response regulator, partial [Deltaproteobacteria bacterium]|nr:response regulator [Deltaproteobacteria bacterium]
MGIVSGNILVVDDTEENLRILVEALGNKGYKVRPALNGQIALKAARKETPDLILLDIIMPGMDGYQVCDALKADKVLKDVPVIFISALDEVGDKVKGFSAGGVDYISKPFQMEEVLARVKTQLTLRHLRKELEEKNIRLQQTNESLRKSEEKYRSLVENIHEALIVEDVNGKLVYVNDRFCKMFGYNEN